MRYLVQIQTVIETEMGVRLPGDTHQEFINSKDDEAARQETRDRFGRRAHLYKEIPLDDL